MARKKKRKDAGKPLPRERRKLRPRKKNLSPQEYLERYEAAQKLAREIKKAKLRDLKEQGLSEEQIREKMRAFGHFLPSYLLEVRKDLIDKMMEKKRKWEKVQEEGKKKKSSDIPFIGGLADIAKAFKDYLEGKRSKLDSGEQRQKPESKDSKSPHKRQSKSASKWNESKTETRKIDNSSDSKTTKALRTKDDIFSEVRRLRREKAQATESSFQKKPTEGEQHPPTTAKREPKKQGQERPIEDLTGSVRVRVKTPAVRGEEITSGNHMRSLRQRDFPGLDSRFDLDDLERQVDDHFKTLDRFGGRRWTSYGEIREFAEEIGAPEATVRAWVEKGALPRMYSLLEGSLTMDEGQELAQKIHATLPGIETREKFDEQLKHPYYQKHVVSNPKHEERYDVVVKFYNILDELELGGTTEDIAKRAGTLQSNVSRWSHGRRPLLIQQVLDGPKETRPTERFGVEPITSQAEKQQMLNRHPHLRDMKRFPDMERMADGYLSVKDLQRTGRLGEKTYREWAKELGISNSALRSYIGNKKIPELFDLLYRNERDCREHEAKLSPEAFDHRINPAQIYASFRQLRDNKNPNAQELADAIEKTLESSGLDAKLQWAELRPYSYGGPKWLRNIANRIEKNRDEIERLLNTQLGLDGEPDKRMRISVVESKLYMRLHDLSVYNWMNIYKNELFYFKNLKDKDGLLDETMKRLGIKGTHYLSDIINDLTDHERSVTTRQTKTDLKMNCDYLRGESLHLALDATNQTIQDIQNQIANVGRAGKDAGKINNPRFPANPKEIDRIFAAIFGAGLSDGHVELKSEGFGYYESNRNRVRIFRKAVMKLGDVEYSESVAYPEVIRTRFPTVMGRALIRKGMPAGDKAIHNVGLPEWLLNSDINAARIYISNMWPEEASFYSKTPTSTGRLQWTRGIALYDPTKANNYRIEGTPPEKYVWLVKKHGKFKDDAPLGPRYRLTGRELSRLQSHGNEKTSKSARALRNEVLQHKSNLQLDERLLLRKMGINSSDYLVSVNLYVGSGRLSSTWSAYTNTKEDAMRVVILTPSYDTVKRPKADFWKNANPVLRNEILKKLIREGLLSDTEHYDEGW